MSRQVIDNRKHILEFKPLNEEGSRTYSLESPGDGYAPVKFWTATSDMHLLNKNGVLYIEHLKVDGTMDLLPYNGIHAGNDNFINIGWQKDNHRVYLRIDIYTGDFLKLEENG